MESRRADCTVCNDGFDRADLVTIARHLVCHGCLTTRFQLAVDDESLYPVVWGTLPLDINDPAFADCIPLDVRDRFARKKAEYDVPPAQRIFCKAIRDRYSPTAGRALCGAFVGARASEDEDEGEGEHVPAADARCPTCQQPTCMACGESTPALVPHACKRAELARADVAAFEGLVRGRDYQICPNKRCARKLELRDGCNHIFCMCTQQLCFVCGEQATDTSGHWTRISPNEVRCPRYNRRDEANAIVDNLFEDQDDRALRRFLEAGGDALAARRAGYRIGRAEAEDADDAEEMAAVHRFLDLPGPDENEWQDAGAQETQGLSQTLDGAEAARTARLQRMMVQHDLAWQRGLRLAADDAPVFAFPEGLHLAADDAPAFAFPEWQPRGTQPRGTGVWRERIDRAAQEHDAALQRVEEEGRQALAATHRRIGMERVELEARLRQREVDYRAEFAPHPLEALEARYLAHAQRPRGREEEVRAPGRPTGHPSRVLEARPPGEVQVVHGRDRVFGNELRRAEERVRAMRGLVAPESRPGASHQAQMYAVDSRRVEEQGRAMRRLMERRMPSPVDHTPVHTPAVRQRRVEVDDATGTQFGQPYQQAQQRRDAGLEVPGQQLRAYADEPARTFESLLRTPQDAARVRQGRTTATATTTQAQMQTQRIADPVRRYAQMQAPAALQEAPARRARERGVYTTAPVYAAQAQQQPATSTPSLQAFASTSHHVSHATHGRASQPRGNTDSSQAYSHYPAPGAQPYNPAAPHFSPRSPRGRGSMQSSSASAMAGRGAFAARVLGGGRPYAQAPRGPVIATRSNSPVGALGDEELAGEAGEGVQDAGPSGGEDRTAW
ncbi:hypothetical protein LTR08_000354 [Meristemomyces frigidus]|nr:hypothetical protein LTR08_000354 [Meristemomyces frigidus]